MIPKVGQLVTRQNDMSKMEEVLAMKEVDMIKKKLAFRVHGILTFNGENLEDEIDAKTRDAQFAKVQGDVARLNKKFAGVSLDIAKGRTALATRHVSIAKARKTLGKAQHELARAMLAGASEDAIKTRRRKCQIIENSLNDEISAEWIKRNEVRRKQDELLGLTKAMAMKMDGVDGLKTCKP